MTAVSSGISAGAHPNSALRNPQVSLPLPFRRAFPSSGLAPVSRLRLSGYHRSEGSKGPGSPGSGAATAPVTSCREQEPGTGSCDQRRRPKPRLRAWRRPERFKSLAQRKGNRRHVYISEHGLSRASPASAAPPPLHPPLVYAVPLSGTGNVCCGVWRAPVAANAGEVPPRLLPLRASHQPGTPKGYPA